MISMTRRNILAYAAALAAAALSPRSVARAQSADKRTRLILLGTGGGPARAQAA
jgi:hypothetical protein